MIDEPRLLSFLQSEQSRAVDDELNDARKTAIEMYYGELFGNEIEGLSQVRTRDTAEVVDYMQASVLRTLVSGDKVVEFEPSRPGEEDISQQITDRIHWNFLREQDGYSILRDGIKAGLLEKSGVWKSWVERPKVRQTARMNAAEIDAAGADVVAVQEVPDLYDIDEMTGEPLAVYDVSMMVPGPAKFKDAAIPNEEFFVAPDARTLEDAIYVGNTARVSLSDLMEMGYSQEDVESLWGEGSEGQPLRDARDSKRSETESNVDRADLARIVTLREEYVRTFWEGAYQRIRIQRVANKILSVEPAASQPYTLWCPFPMQHRLIGQSLADKVMDIQVACSHLLRQIMDAGNFANMPRMYIDMNQCDDYTMDDVLDVAPGSPIRGKGPNAVTPIVQPFAAGSAFQALELMRGEKESRTGITRLNQGLDADALNKTATGTAMMQASGQQMEEMIAREAANAIGNLFEKKLQMMIAEMEPHEFRTDGKVVEMDPSQWPADLRLAVRVGLGSGNKDKKLQSIMLLKQTQAEAIQLDPRMVSPEKAFETAKLVTSTLGLGPATQYFNDPAGLEPQPEQPSPEVVKAQMEAQAKQAETQAQQQFDMAKLEMEREDRAARLQLDREVREAELALARENAARDYDLKMQQIIMKANVDANMAANRAGGSLNA
jgi:hypothetical protein